MKITSVTIGKSVQVFQIGHPEYWHKVTISADLSETDGCLNVVDDLFALVNAAHEKHSQSMVESQLPPKDKRQTFEDLKRELDVTRK